MTSITVTDVSKSFHAHPPVHALREVDLQVESEELFAILGPSGCGKTTLLRILAGFEDPDTGTVAIGERTVADGRRRVAPEQRGVGIVPQEGGLFPHLDVARNIGFGLRRLGRHERHERVEELLELIDLRGHGARRPHELSGGQQQRVALARALAPRPSVVLLDEPFAALDTGMRATLRDQVADLLRQTGTTAVLVTHDQTEALSIADRVAVMRAGRVVQVDRPEAIYARPVDVDVARFVGDCVLLRTARRPDGRVATVLGEHPAVSSKGLAPPAAWAMVRPEQIVPATRGGVEAVVEHVRFEGATVRVTLRIGEDDLVARWTHAHRVEPGTRVAVTVDGVMALLPGPAETLEVIERVDGSIADFDAAAVVVLADSEV